MQKTTQQFQEVIKVCKDLFHKKMKDYGTAWRVLRPSSVTDQLYIKLKRLVTLQTAETTMVNDESEEDVFIAIVNYAIIGLIQLEKGVSENLTENEKETLKLYDEYAQKALQLMQ